jgi:purine-nucleoside phosphorylase
LLKKIKESADFICKKRKISPVAGIILGSGLGSFSGEIRIDEEIPFHTIPHFPVAGVDGHKGSLLIGSSGNVPVIILQGRVHFYEGFSMREITYPVRVLKYLGIQVLFLTNAAGGINPDFEVGDIMMIRDHISMMPNPLIGKNLDEFGPRFPEMSEAYDKRLIEMATEIAKSKKIKLHQGVYVGVTGPTYETPSEYNFFRVIGGDAVGMSTVPEVIVARHMGIRCFALSVITDLGTPGKTEHLTHDRVMKESEKAEPVVADLLKELISSALQPSR